MTSSFAQVYLNLVYSLRVVKYQIDRYGFSWVIEARTIAFREEAGFRATGCEAAKTMSHTLSETPL